ncbi:30S ribosomal protein S3 [Candidatus Atelocyanobacterium thalassae]|uniref:Small ribosomal subunit protein uS3 n=1 Tax=Atelocyanobacterium thalassa (isolate ALOHA) TaxID=1453429 RepID=D3EQF8_ATETH|nr:30S ribosomal protein S3 [Candidatus Atelocyanobacterium thalassa]ADB95708.1 SSU ribosomal protein S3P [Candidatus Atelocyanobacterium thalassa isolate ALOHA]MCH2543073.1 30S ribosomal protein S3 [Candidatus Atelocyanobacterium sp. ALOHA_A2.5_9]|tara:strand:+ start:54 stop:776 length:723 start_codon:yes stop_codon:yes gene_type:complete
MGQKIHPIGFRLGITKEHKSRWYADKRRYPELLQEDLAVRKHIEKNLSNAGIADIRIERKADQIDLAIHTARPGVVVGRGGSGIEQLRTALQKNLGENRQIRINVIEVSRVDADAALIAEYITQQLERRVSFRRVVRQAIQRAQRAEVKGIKIQVGGRLNGAEIARSEWVREGRVPLHTLRADIDYSYRTAQTTYGILGVKVWVFKGEIIPGQEEQTTTSAPPTPKRNRRKQFEDRSNEE